MSWDIDVVENYCSHCGRGEVIEDINVTYNLGQIFFEATGHSVRDWADVSKNDLIRIFSEGMRRIEADPQRFKAMEPDNGWGTTKTAHEVLKRLHRSLVDGGERLIII